MNYRHAFHAGNFADVLKHATLALVIEHLKQKPTPFRVIDTHAGVGLYDLTGVEASRTGEWRDGIGRLIGPNALPITDAVRPLLAPLLDVVASCNVSGELEFYPGSPRVALALMRPGDRLIANELHPIDRIALERVLGRDRRAKALGLDGWQALRSLLPPKERRGIVLVDPPFEQVGEFDRLQRGLSEAMARFATGIFLLWYPLKDGERARRFRSALVAGGKSEMLSAELVVGADAPRLTGSGLVVVNPPFKLAQQLESLLEFLAERLGRDAGARWSCTRL